MKLTLGKFHVRDIQFSDKSYFHEGVLHICKKELAAHLLQDSRIKEIDFDIARPGESTRIVPVKDIIQPRYKVSGGGQVFPGFVGEFDTVGQGVTHSLEGCCVATTGQIVAFQEGIIDMSGPGTKYNSFSRMCILALLITPVDNIGKHAHEETVRVAGLKTAAYLGEMTKDLVPEETETFKTDPISNLSKLYPGLPRVVYTYMIQCQGLMHDTYVYGLNVKGILPTMIEPTEVLDGAIVSGNCASPGHKNTSLHHMQNPVILNLLRRHGKDLCFAGVIITIESALLADKKRSAFYASNLARLIGAEGAIITEEGGGNPETDLMLNCKYFEANGIKTVLITDEYAGRDGASQGLADVTPEADAVITNGNGNEYITLPKMDKIIGKLENVKIITGGNASSIGEDGSVSVEIAAIMGSLCELGYEKMTTRLR